jgi:alpha-mannosidase
MPGRQEFVYSIIPHEGDWASSGTHVQAVQFLRPMRARWNRRGLGHLRDTASLVEVDSPAFAVSAIKRAEDGDGVVVRLYNIYDREAVGSVDIVPLDGEVSMVNLNEERISEVPRVDGRAPLTARRNEIITLRFRR